MSIRIVTATAIAFAFSSPAFADCSQELKALEQTVVSAETGASTNGSGMPVTKHQEEVLAGKQTNSDPEITGSTAGTVKSTSPHQEQVTGMPGSEHPSQLMAEARKMSESGDEQGCMKKVGELKDMLGVK